MKSSKTNKIQPCECGSVQFVSQPNRYDVYEIIEDKLELTFSPFTEEEVKIFCRECGKELLNAEELVSA